MTTPNSLFGGGANKPAGGSIFGGSGFGTPSANSNSAPNASGTPAPPSLFGSTGAFGAANPSSTTQPSNIFGGGNNSSTSAAPSTISFGGQPAPTAPTPSLFGNNNSAPTGGLFGFSNNASKPASTNPTAAAPTPAFGTTTTPSAFSLNPPTSSTGTAPSAPSLFSGFGQTPAKPPAASAPATSAPPLPTTSGGGLFGSLGKPTTTPAAPSAPSAPSGGLFGFGKPSTPAAAPPTTSTPNTGSAPPPAPAPAFSLFGGAKAAEKTDATPAASSLFGAAKVAPTAEKKDGAPAAIPTFFGAAPSSTPQAPPATEKKDPPAAPATTASSLFGAKPAGSTTTAPAAPLGSLFGAKPAEPAKPGAVAATTTANASTSNAVAVAPPSMLRGKTIEDIINRWTSELEQRVKEFGQFASEVAVWDRALIENGNALNAIYSHVLNAEKEQSDVDHALEHVEQQQRDLLAALDSYEKTAGDLLQSQGRGIDQGPADTERDKNYQIATDLHSNLDDLSESLTEMIESVNKLTPANEGDDAMTQIAQILSGHLDSLQWIGNAVSELEGKVSETEKGLKDSGLLTGGTQTRSKR